MAGRRQGRAGRGAAGALPSGTLCKGVFLLELLRARTRARVCVRMGCGASSAVPPEQNAAAPPAEGRSGAKDDLRSCWEAVAGDGAGATLSERQVRGVLEELGKRLSDDEFAAAFKAMDSNGTGAYTAAFALPPVFLL